jgi:hypothetical protein
LQDKNSGLLSDETYHLNFYSNLLVSIFTTDVLNTREADQPSSAVAKGCLLADIVCAIKKAAFDLTAQSIGIEG